MHSLDPSRPITVTSIGDESDDSRLGASHAEWVELEQGVHVGRYWLKRQLGSGGMGVVYEAYDPELDRAVAVKLLHSELDRQRLAREARALAKLSHPNVVGVYDFGAFGDQSFIAMELVEGATLRAWAAERRRSLDEILAVALQAGRGLAAAHAAGLLHRDFKPDNVIVGRDGRVRVVDFGIVGDIPSVQTFDSEGCRAASEFLAPQQEQSRLTTHGALVGTPAYMAPEQLQAQVVTACADQFSFCVVLWELVHGSRPFSRDSLLQLTRSGELARVGAPNRAAAAPSWLQRCLERGLSLDSAARYPSMQALLDVLETGANRQAAEGRLLGRRYDLLPVMRPSVAGVERALDRISGRLVAVWRLNSRAAPRAAKAEPIDRLKRLVRLRHPNLVRVLDFGFDHGGAPYCVLEWSDAALELSAASRRSGAPATIDLLFQLLHALGYLHGQGLFIGSLDPSSFLLVGDCVKLVPAACVAAQDYPSLHAPELHAGVALSATADLHAFGSFALALLTANTSPKLHVGIGTGGLAGLGLDARLVPVFERLLQHEPSARYQSAAELARALSQALGSGGAPTKSWQSMLGATPLVARSAELGQLEAGLLAAQSGRGSAWLMTGESGVGKSRMLEELETLGVVHGFVVLRGQDELEGGSPYRLFRDVLDGLTLLTDLDELEAGVLLPAIPNLAQLLKRAVTPAPELDAPSTRSRFLEVAEKILRRQAQPLLVLLEDLQWSKDDSFDLLGRLATSATSLPLMLVVTARSDQRLAQRSDLGALQSLPLQRLSGASVAELACAVIGDGVLRPDLLELLERESEGNAFFVVEGLRALAEKAGGLEQVATMALPPTVFAGGVESLVRDQLSRVSGKARAALSMAAVVGRRIERQLLGALLPDIDLERCLGDCVAAAILEHSGDGLRFRHDKLRDGVLSILPDFERRALHEHVARTMEAMHSGTRERFADLAYHFAQASLPGPAARYAALAGQEALLHGNLQEAIRLLELAQAGPTTTAEALGQSCVSLADAYYFATDLTRATRAALRAAQAVRIPFPEHPVHRVGVLLGQLLLHVVYRLLPPWLWRGRESQRAAARVATLAAACLARISISTGDAAGVLLFSLLSWNLAERAQYPEAFASGNLGYALAALGFPGLGRRYFDADHGGPWGGDRSYPVLKTSFLLGMGELAAAECLSRSELTLARRTGFKPAQAFGWFLLGYCAYYRGRLTRAERCFRLSVAHEGTRANFAPVLALLRCARGRNSEATALLEQGLSAANPAIPRSLALSVLALIQWREGARDSALASAAEAARLAGRGTAFGYAGAPFFTCLFEVHLAELERAKRAGNSPRLAVRTLARLARHCRAWARAFRVGEPLHLYYMGRIAEVSGQHARAEPHLRRSRTLAQQLGLGLYEALATAALAGAPGDPMPRRALASSST